MADGPLTAEDCTRALLAHGLDCTDGCGPGYPPVCDKGRSILRAKRSLNG